MEIFKWVTVLEDGRLASVVTGLDRGGVIYPVGDWAVPEFGYLLAYKDLESATLAGTAHGWLSNRKVLWRGEAEQADLLVTELLRYWTTKNKLEDFWASDLSTPQAQQTFPVDPGTIPCVRIKLLERVK